MSDFGFRRSVATVDNGCVVVCLSRSNADMTVSCNGQMLTIATSGGDATWTAVGADVPSITPAHPAEGSQLGYVASVTLNNGFEPNTNYTYTVSQSGTSYSANIYVVPNDKLTDFALFFATCDNNTSLSGAPGGYYQYIRQYANNGDLPVAGILHVDDHYGYVDFALVDDEAGTGHHYISKYVGGTAKDTVTAYNQGDTPAATMYEYDYALGYFAAFGLFTDTTNDYVNFGHNEDRIWCFRNIGMMPQWGDHDAGANEMGWDITSAGDTRFTSAKALWDLIQKPLIATEIAATQNRDTTAYHWAKDLGPLRIVCPDAITNGSGDATTPLDAGNGPTTLYGNNQIDDCLDALNVSAEFKLLGLTHSIRYMYSPVGSPKNAYLAQNPLADECPTEYARWFTASGNTPPSIMDGAKTNGVLGTTVCLHADMHVCAIIKHENTSGALDEWFYEISQGTINGSVNFLNSAGLVAGDSHEGSTIEMVETSESADGTFYGCRLDVMASRHPKELIIGLYDMTNAELWRKKFVAGRGGNDALDVGTEFVSVLAGLSQIL